MCFIIVNIDLDDGILDPNVMSEADLAVLYPDANPSPRIRIVSPIPYASRDAAMTALWNVWHIERTAGVPTDGAEPINEYAMILYNIHDVTDNYIVTGQPYGDDSLNHPLTDNPNRDEILDRIARTEAFLTSDRFTQVSSLTEQPAPSAEWIDEREGDEGHYSETERVKPHFGSLPFFGTAEDKDRLSDDIWDEANMLSTPDRRLAVYNALSDAKHYAAKNNVIPEDATADDIIDLAKERFPELANLLDSNHGTKSTTTKSSNPVPETKVETGKAKIRG